MKRRSKNDVFLRVAGSYLREAFPNPMRTGCLADSVLRGLADNPTHTDSSVSEHISFCSPCLVRYMELLGQQKSHAPAKFSARVRYYWSGRRNRFMWASAAALLLASIAVLLHVSRGAPSAGSHNPISYSDFLIDFTGASVLRGGERGNPDAEIQVPRSALNLAIQLPIGSEQGSYRVSLQSGSISLWSQSAEAHLVDHVMTLKVQVDLRPFHPGKYVLMVESINRIRFTQRIQITDPEGTGSLRRSLWS